ncbi:MAG: hypothetical protein PSV22_20495 [Pseudolabrys sp.]|jgi:hypothetical protein|nr:hypothetical protein [Pseudolabrys sp.]
MKEAAKERGLNEMNADSIGRTPFNVAIPLGDLGPDEKRKIVRDAYRALDFKRRARAGEVANNAVNAGRKAKND